jgi:diguanylate cyclase (GGDEF)-like protein
LQAVRTGASAYFTKPIDINELVDKLDVLTFQQTPEPYRILIVEDEPELAKSYALTLQEAGMITEMITDPIQIMQPLSEFKPDLILMDVYMPVCNGIELTKVIRQQETFVSIPIVFLSSEFNPDKQLAAMRLGGDDFLTKPIHAEHLISAVTSRVQRLRTLRSFMVKDSLTGLLNHTEIKKQLDTEVSRARRENRKFSFAMIDIDHFKSINDTYGHPTGDRVLKSLSRFLQQRLRKTDIIGRYGGEEFAMILLGADGPAAEKVMNKIRIDFSKVRQQAEQTEFFISFSCGIAPFPEFSDSTLINDIADKALYRAKESGRNQVVLSSK